MFSSLKLYLAAGVAVALVVAVGSFVVYKKTMEAEVATLKTEKAQLQSNVDKMKIAVQLSEQTVKLQQEAAKKQAETNGALAKSLAEAEAENLDRISKLKDEDLAARSVSEPDNVEKEINDAFKEVNAAVRSATVPAPAGK
jgi:hypothetical protein